MTTGELMEKLKSMDPSGQREVAIDVGVGLWQDGVYNTFYTPRGRQVTNTFGMDLVDGFVLLEL